MGGQFSILALWTLCSESAGAWNFEILVEDSDTGGPSSIAVRIECLRLSFQFQYVNFVWKTMMGRQKALLNKRDEGEAAYLEKNEEKFMTHLKLYH